MFEWIWTHIVLPTIGAAIENIPWWIWVILFGLLCGLAYKAYKVLGWPGVIGIALAALSFGAYRQGWLNAVQRHEADRFTPPAKKPRPTIFGGKPASGAKRKYNADLNIWE